MKQETPEVDNMRSLTYMEYVKELAALRPVTPENSAKFREVWERYHKRSIFGDKKD